MNKSIVIPALVLMVIGGFFFYNYVKTSSGSARNTVATDQVMKNQGTQIDDQADVSVSVTPDGLSSGAEDWKFSIEMSTHVVELDQDMMKITVLVDDRGEVHKPTAWVGPTGGHHRSGVLVFASIDPLPRSVELRISGIGNVIRTFSFQVKEQ